MSSERKEEPPTVEILALQGDVEPHRKMLERLGARVVEVRTAHDLRQVDGLILPGGESTTIGKLLDRFGLLGALKEQAESGMPLYGTCAGMILMAKQIEGSDQHRLGLLDVTVARNAFGRQVDSFEADIPLPAAGDSPIRGVFIRAPFVSNAAPEVEILGRFEDRIVAVREGSLLATAFHPELTDDSRVHALFLEMVRKKRLVRV